MKRIVVRQYGGLDVLEMVEEPTPEPAPGQVRVRLTSIGMNHADLMARRGEYRLSSGDPPFTPGLEGGGVIDAVGPGVTDRFAGQRVTLSPGAPRRSGTGSLDGTYRTHFVTAADQTIPVPQGVPDEQLGALWLTYLTAWGCLIWKQGLRPGQTVAIPAASSGVGLAASQIVRRAGAVPIGLTTSPEKVERLRRLEEAQFEEIILTRGESGEDRPWHRDLMRLTGGRGIDLFFDPVGAGPHLDMEIRALAQRGTIWVYGLLGSAGTVDVSPLIRKYGAIRGWVLTELIEAGGPDLERGCREILDGFEQGSFRQVVAERFPLEEVRRAHEVMERGAHIGKLILVP